MNGSNVSYKFSYDKEGAIPPTAAGTPSGSLLVLAALLLPLIPHLRLARESLSPLVIQYLPNFWTLQRAGLVSDSDLALIERATGLWLLARFAHFFLFRRELLSFFSEKNPPPPSLQERWPRQFSKFLAFGSLIMMGPFALAPLTYCLGMLNSRYAFVFFALFGGGCLFLTEGLISLGLYSAFKSKFWRRMEETTFRR